MAVCLIAPASMEAIDPADVGTPATGEKVYFMSSTTNAWAVKDDQGAVGVPTDRELIEVALGVGCGVVRTLRKAAANS